MSTGVMPTCRRGPEYVAPWNRLTMHHEVRVAQIRVLPVSQGPPLGDAARRDLSSGSASFSAFSVAITDPRGRDEHTETLHATG